MLAIPLLTFQLIAVEVGRNLSENVKPALHQSLPLSVAPTAKSSPQSLSLALSSGSAANPAAFTQPQSSLQQSASLNI
jgi:hypothetical protein